jgi:hypothetical protein
MQLHRCGEGVVELPRHHVYEEEVVDDVEV